MTLGEEAEEEKEAEAIEEAQDDDEEEEEDEQQTQVKNPPRCPSEDPLTHTRTRGVGRELLMSTSTRLTL